MVLTSVLNVRPSRGLFPGVKDAVLNVMKGYYAGVQILLIYPFIGWNGSISDFLSDTAVDKHIYIIQNKMGIIHRNRERENTYTRTLLHESNSYL